MTDADILERAADRLEKPGAWCQGAEARNAAGEYVLAFETEACSWCIVGAIWCEYPYNNARVWPALRKVLRTTKTAAEWNDAPGRTQAEVVSALRETAKRLRGEKT